MNQRPIISTVGLIACVLITPAWGLEVLRTKTEARILPPSPVTPVVIQLEFKAQVSNNGFSELGSEDVVVTWQQSGDVAPQPFKVFIPAGCFVANDGFHVRDYVACGVQLTVDLGRGAVALSIREFAANLKLRRDGTARFIVEASFTDRDREHAILGALGGSAVEIVIGDAMGTAVPNLVETVGGQPPDDN